MQWTKLTLLSIIKDRERERAQGHKDGLVSITLCS